MNKGTYVVWSSLWIAPENITADRPLDAAKKFYDKNPLVPPIFNSSQRCRIFVVDAESPGVPCAYDVCSDLTMTDANAAPPSDTETP